MKNIKRETVAGNAEMSREIKFSDTGAQIFLGLMGFRCRVTFTRVEEIDKRDFLEDGNGSMKIENRPI